LISQDPCNYTKTIKAYESWREGEIGCGRGVGCLEVWLVGIQFRGFLEMEIRKVPSLDLMVLSVFHFKSHPL
jgi:hypothetical protein